MQINCMEGHCGYMGSREKRRCLFYTEYVVDSPLVHSANHGSTDVTASSENVTFVSFTASPYLKSTLDICYRTMPCIHEDIHLRPDLRLGFSDAAVRKVATIVRWFETMAGLTSV